MIRNLFEKIKSIVISLRFSILTIFITLFLTTMLLIIAITSIRFSSTLSYTSFELMKYASEAVLRELTTNLRPASTQVMLTSDLLKEGVIKNDTDKIVSYTYSVVKTIPLVQSAYLTDESGNHIHAFKTENNQIISEIENRNTKPPERIDIVHDSNGNIIQRTKSNMLHLDERTVPWYLQAKKAKKAIWSNIRLSENIKEITAASPFYDQAGKFSGVFGLNVSLENLSNFVANQHISEHGFTFIITKDENLVAYPKRPPFTTAKINNHDKLLNVHEISLPIIDASLDIYKKTHEEFLKINDAGTTYLVTYEPVKELSDYGWLIGVVIPMTDFTAQLQRINIISLLVSFGILTLGIWFVSKLITRIVNPINLLVEETQRIKNFNLKKTVPIQSRIKEVILLRDAIDSMKTGLRSFQKYLPQVLVHQLIESGEDIRAGGVRKQLTVLFSDIENFTTITEEMDPNNLLNQLCEYFEVISQIILQEKGTIDKYIGDSVMAFWGAPLNEDHLYEHAAHAALQCQHVLKDLNARWRSQGKPMFQTRIGIHTGEAIVGNLGSSDRLNYTALGDTINTASRLEQINKFYRTKIIVSDAFYQRVKDKFVLRMIDFVTVKGRAKGSCLYELLAENINEVPFDIVRYQDLFTQAFNTYKEQQWDLAIEFFMQCLSIYPEDTIAPIFIARCQQFKVNPPDKGWQGIIKIKV